MSDLDATIAGEHYATWSNGCDEGRRHGHKECRDEIARLRALLADVLARAGAGVSRGDSR